MSDRKTKAADPARDLCEALARHVEVSGSEIYSNRQRLNGEVVATVWCVVGQHAAEFDAMVREWFRQDRFNVDAGKL